MDEGSHDASMQGLVSAPWRMPNVQGSRGASDCGNEVSSTQFSAEVSIMWREKKALILSFASQFTLG